eukprot:gene23302-37220_t
MRASARRAAAPLGVHADGTRLGGSMRGRMLPHHYQHNPAVGTPPAHPPAAGGWADAPVPPAPLSPPQNGLPGTPSRSPPPFDHPDPYSSPHH